MSRKSAERALLRLFTRKPIVNYQGDLLFRLHHELGGNHPSSAIGEAIGKMEKKGLVAIGRSGNVMNSVEYLPPTGPGPSQVTAVLEDPVDVTSISDDEKSIVFEKIRDAEDPVDPTTVQPEDEHVPMQSSKQRKVVVSVENLNQAWNVLREFAEADGTLGVNSASEAIEYGMECTKSHAVLLNNCLGKMGLRTSIGKGGGKFSHSLKMEITEVTEEMLLATKKGHGQPMVEKSSKSVESPSDQTDSKAVESLQYSSGDGEQLNIDDTLYRLAGIVRKLEDERDQLVEALDVMTHERDDLSRQNSELEAKLIEQQVQSPTVKAILDRYENIGN